MNPEDTLTVEGSGDLSATAGAATRTSCPDTGTLKALTEIQNAGIGIYEKGQDNVFRVIDRLLGYKEKLCGEKPCCCRRCTEPPVAHPPIQYQQPPPAPPPATQPERTRLWVVVLVSVGALMLCGGVTWLVWYMLSGTSKTSPSGVAPVTKDCCMTPKEWLDTQERMLKMKDHHGSNNVPTQSGAPQTTHQASNTLAASKSFGKWVVPEAGVVAAVYECITGEAVNLRRYSGSMLDGVDKFDLTASIAATYLVNHFKVIYTEGESPHLENSGAIPDTCSFVTDLAYNAGDRTLHDNPRHDESSLDWWINSTLQKIPSSDVTDFSNTVRAAINNLDDGLKSTDSEDGLNGVTRVKYDMPEVFASYASTATTTKSGGAKKSAPKGSGLSPLNMATAPYKSLGYISPIPAGCTQIPGGEFGVWRTKKGGYYHEGEDLAPLVKGRKDRAVNPAPGVGTVISAQEEGTFGKCVRLDVGDAVIIFAHLDSFGEFAIEGSRIKQGETIGTIGNTGDSDGVHLHIEFVPKVPNFIVPIFIEEEQAGAYSSGLSRLKIKI